MEIISLHYNRPDFIELQYNSVMKYVKNATYRVYDNSNDDLIENECKRLRINRTKIDVEKIEDDISGNVSKLWKEIWKDHHENVVIMDGDMFFTSEFKMQEDMMYVPHYTNDKEWIWPNFVAFKKIENPEELDWGFFPIDGIHSDIGSGTYPYLQKYKPNVKHIDREVFSEYFFDRLSIDGKPFLLHYKCSSNYAPESTDEWNRLKTESMLKLLHDK